VKQNQLVLIASGILWLLAVAIGIGIVWDYSLSPSTPGIAPVRWPSDSQIQRIPHRATLIMLAHPRCPCTRASIGELALIMAHSQRRVTAYVLFFKPMGFPDAWVKTGLWHSAAAIPGVNVMIDDTGIEARRFGSITSGQTILYDAEGYLLFSGGITAARGHSGDNAGRSAIISFLTKGAADRNKTFVFGCYLMNTSSN